jgi:ADP-heptose:LPS heptosyltransferase
MPRLTQQPLDQDQHLRILIVRTDRLGDVILSTPVFEAIKKHYVKAHLTAMLTDAVVPIVRGLPNVDHLMVFDPAGKHAGLRGFFRLFQEIRRRHFRIAVVLQTHWKIAFALFLARVHYRVGPLSKPHSFLFYNRGMRQRRSHVEMHETDYNLQLLRKIGIRVGSRSIPTQVHLSDEVQKLAEDWLRQKRWNFSTDSVAVHPGMGGSALNWPESHYLELIQGLVQSGRQVLVTGGPAEAGLLERLKRALGEVQSSVFFYLSTPPNAIDFLGGLYSQMDVVVAPSTGPLHLAVALGIPVVTFYPPIRVQSALRWGPYLQDENRASVLVPEVYCGQDFECLGNLCNYFPCMKSLSVRRTLQEVQRTLLLSHRDRVDPNHLKQKGQ